MSHRAYAGILLVVSALLSVSPARAYRTEYRVLLDGKRKDGSEVCFYAARSATDPFALYFSSPVAMCLPADKILDVPPGMFHVFARHSDGYVSGYRDTFVNRGAPRPEQGYELLDIPLDPAAHVDFSGILPTLQSGQAVGVWLAQTKSRSATFFPLVNGESTLLVPADRPFVPMLVGSGVPISIGGVKSLAPGARYVVPPFTTSAGYGDVAIWMKLDGTSAAELSEDVPPPQVAIRADGRDVAPTVPLIYPLGANNTFVFFKNVPPGTHQLRSGAPAWLQVESPLVVRRGELTVRREPVILSPASVLTVQWTASPEPAAADACRGTNRGALNEPRATVTLLRCSAPLQGHELACVPFDRRTEIFDVNQKFVFENIVPGNYRLAVDPPFGASIVKDVKLVAAKEAREVLPLVAFSFFGRVSVNGRPAAARLIFESGESTSGDDGRYTATLAADPRTNTINVYECGSGTKHNYIPTSPIVQNAPFDIDIRESDVSVEVTEGDHTPVEDAVVRYSVVRPSHDIEPISIYSSDAHKTDSRGRIVLSAAPTDYSLVVCARKDGYEQSCSTPVLPKDWQSKPVSIVLRRARVGRVEGHAGVGQIAWVDQANRTTEQVAVATDGSFTFKLPHSPADHVVYFSDRLPLYALPMPDSPADGLPLVITLPRVGTRTFTVKVEPSPSGAGLVGLWVGGRYVPVNVLAQFEDSRNHDVVVTASGAVTLADIADTGELSVAYAPVNSQRDTNADVFTLPENVNAERHPVVGQSVVVPLR